MKAELLNLSLFVSAIAKVLLMTGVAAAPLLALAIRVRGGFWAPVAIGKVYRVERHYLGDFVCEILDVDRDLARIRVTDPMRPIPKVKNRCCFPQCVREDFHPGDHEFSRVREGAVLEIHWRTAEWVPIGKPEQVSAAGQLAIREKVPASFVATSPARKVRRYA